MTTSILCPDPFLVFIEHTRYAPGVSVRSGKLPEDWDKPIPEALWPETLLSAIRHDIGALASPRVIATLLEWRTNLVTGDAAQQREARRRLRAAGEALQGTPEILDDPVTQDTSDLFTVEAFPKPPPTTHLRARPKPSSSKRPKDDRLIKPTDHPASLDKAPSSASENPANSPVDSPPEPIREPAGKASLTQAGGWGPTDAEPVKAKAKATKRPKTTLPSQTPEPGEPNAAPRANVGGRAVPDRDPLTIEPDATPRANDAKAAPRAGGPALPDRDPVISPAFAEDNEPPTTHIPLSVLAELDAAKSADEADDAPDEAGTVDGVPASKLSSEAGTIDGVPASQVRAADVAAEKPTAHIPLPNDSGPRLPPARAISNLPANEKAVLEHISVPPEPEQIPSRLAPKPGVLRRRPGRPPSTVRRPRASMHHVRSLYTALMPFAEELVPLAFERRSRRFWARWREVAGDHGVRRHFVEDLLRTATDAKAMVCELIGEVHSVDPESVSELIDRLRNSMPSSAAPAPSGPRRKSALVGASVKARLSNDER